MNTYRQQIIGYVRVNKSLSKNELLSTEAETYYLLAVIGMICLQTLVTQELKKSSTTWIFQLIKSRETELPGRRLITCRTSARGCLVGKTGGLGFWREELAPEKKGPCQDVILERRTLEGSSCKWGKILEIRKLCGDGRQGARGPWSLTPKSGGSGTAGPDPAFCRASWGSYDLPAGGTWRPGRKKGNKCRI